MYAIIENGGKQYKAIEGGYIEIDLLPDEVGKKKTFDKVLLLSTDEKVEVGTPTLKGVSVDSTIISHFKAPKVTIFKYRPKQRYRVKTGHRQRYTRVVVDSIAFPGKSAASKKAEKVEPIEMQSEKKSATKKQAASKKSTTTAKKKAPAKKPTTTKKPAPAKKTTTTKKSTTAAKKVTTKKTVAKKSATTAKKTTAKKPVAKKSATTAKKSSTAAKKSTTAKKKPAADKKE